MSYSEIIFVGISSNLFFYLIKLLFIAFFLNSSSLTFSDKNQYRIKLEKLLPLNLLKVFVFLIPFAMLLELCLYVNKLYYWINTNNNSDSLDLQIYELENSLKRLKISYI